MALGKQLSWTRNHCLNLVERETSFFRAHRFELASRYFRIDGDLIFVSQPSPAVSNIGEAQGKAHRCVPISRRLQSPRRRPIPPR
jgi:hypothetical protein